MTIMKMRSVRFSAFIMGLVVAGSFAHAASSKNEILVRFKDAQNSRIHALESTRDAIGSNAAKLSLVSLADGLVKLSFDSEADLVAAQTKLALSTTVENVSPNFLYKPAVRYSFQEREERGVIQFLGLPLVETFFSRAPLPDVLPAPISILAGVDPLDAKDWAMTNIRMPKVSEYEGLIRKSVITAVTDTGTDYNHEDLAGALWRKPGNPLEIGFDTAHGHAKPYDSVHFDIQGCLADWTCAFGIDQSKYLVNPGHGTHCAGHVGAVANNSLGIRGAGAKATTIMTVKFFADAGETNAGQGDDAAAVKAIDYAIANGAKIISASWGGRMKPDEADKSEIKQAILRAQAAGILFVAAAGNDAVDQETIADPGFPAKYDIDNMLVVAATDSKDGLAKFSSYGSKSVHIGAPGVKILSTTVGSQYSDIVATYTDPSGKPGQVDWDGTSMATPIVAGAAALVWSIHPDWDYKQVKAHLLATARKAPGLKGKVVSGAVLDVRAALGL